MSHGTVIERQDRATLSQLSDLIAKSQPVVLLLSGSDVTLLRARVPPLSAARLKAALPNLVEDQLIADPAECIVVKGGLSDGLNTVAVVQRAWLDTLAKTFIALGARHIAALPAQLCLPFRADQTGNVTAAIDGGDDNIEMTLRFSEQTGIGLAIMPEQKESAASAAIRTLCAVVPDAPVTLYVPKSEVRGYQEVINGIVALGKRINVSPDDWSHWIAGASAATLDLMAGAGLRTGPKIDWLRWRWPLRLAAAALVINITALNFDWWMMKNEASALRAAMIQIYKSAYPNQTVIIDPIAQMQQKIAAARHKSGQAAPDDFTAITAAFGEAWSIATASTGKANPIAALEYREHSLIVHLKSSGDAPTQPMKAALAKRDLILDVAPVQSGAVVWQIRSAK